MKEIDIHRGNPTVDEAIDLFYDFIRKSYSDGEKIIKVVTGYGSTSGISLIKDELKLELKDLVDKDQIASFIWGNELDITSSRYINFKYRDLIPETEKRIKNKGCVFVVL